MHGNRRPGRIRKNSTGSRIYGAVKGAFYGLLAGIFLHMAFSLVDLLNRSYF